jgi:uncharacterized protein YoxC
VTSGFDWAIVLDCGVGIGVLLVGIGVLLVCVRLAAVFTRLQGTLDDVNRQINALSPPVVQTLSHVNGIADTADTTVAKLGGVAGAIESVAGSVAKTANLAQRAVAPALVNLGATLTGISAGLRRLVRGRDSGSSDAV